MCGITGVAGNLQGNHDKFLKVALHLDALRGEDGTGVAFITRTDDILVAKQVGGPHELFQDKRFETGLRRVNRAMIGHNRYATQGGISKKTAHPFDFENVVGVHNGTLSNKWKLKGHADYQVDSQALYNHIDMEGIDSAIKELGGPNNAWSLVWWDKVEETLNFLRNKERPMWIVRSKDGESMFWASEAWMLDIATHKAGIVVGDVFETVEDMLYSIHIDNKGVMSKPLVRKVAAPEWVQPVYKYTPPNTQVIKTETKATVTLVGGTASKKALEDSLQATMSLPMADSSYVSAKQLAFEILSCNRDTHGQEYLALFDPLHQEHEVRLYLNSAALMKYKKPEWSSRELVCDVSSFNTGNGSFNGYYKVSPWTIKEVKDLRDEVEVAEFYPDDKGNMLTKAQWQKKYAYCEFCTGNLDPETEYRFSNQGECFCADCVKSDNVKPYVKFK